MGSVLVRVTKGLDRQRGSRYLHWEVATAKSRRDVIAETQGFFKVKKVQRSFAVEYK
jgi:hypothetical protein